MKTLNTILFVGALMVGNAHGALLSVSFTDVAGDNVPDLLSAELVWEDTNGGFTLDYIFSATAPFIGEGFFNLNMLNGDMDAADPDAWVTINRCCFINNITSLVETTLITVTGTELGLTSWEVGDRIANDDSIFGLPVGIGVSAFGSGVSIAASSSNDQFDASFSVVQIVPVPEPATLVLFILGLSGLGFYRLKANA